MVKNTSNENEMKKDFHFYLKDKWKLYLTLFCLFSFITMGLHLEISGSTMLPLSDQVGTNLGHLSWIVAARSFGYIISIVFFGVIFQSITKYHSPLILSIGYLLPTIATALTPHFKSLWTLCLALLSQGMLQGISDLAINTIITRMWLEDSTAPLNLVYLGYAIGALLSIILVQSFRENENHNLIKSYTIVSIFCLITSIGFGYIAYKQYQKDKNEKKSHVRIYQSVAKEEINIESTSRRVFNKAKFWKTCSPTTCGQGYLTYGFIFISLLLLYNFFFGGIEQGFTKFFISFLEREKINFDKKDAIYMMILYWLPMLIGRIICTFLTISLLTPELMLTISLLLSLITYILWLIILWYIGLTHTWIFILVTLNGLSISSISPTTIGWIKQYLILSPIELTFLLSSNAIGGIVFGLISGYIFQNFGSKHLFTVLIIIMILCSIFFLLAYFYQSINSKKHKKSIEDHHHQSLKFIDQD